MRKKRLARLIYERTRLNMLEYADANNISVYALKQGYVSKKTAEIFERDGINWREARGVMVSGGTCASRVKLEAINSEIKSELVQIDELEKGA
ncbi:MAG: hypothetical protein LUC34_00865 [Campylobacter sp.]|nr:hypothetical protein [Campylobacter sp.]